jgi:hypothetical protein
MAKYSFDFNLQAWVRFLEIEADSYEEAVEKLLKKDVSELIELGVVHDSDLDNIDVEILEADYKVRVFDIEWEDEEIETSRLLPSYIKEMTIKDIEVSDEYDNIKREIQYELEMMYDRDVVYFDFEIIECLSAGKNGEGER